MIDRSYIMTLLIIAVNTLILFFAASYCLLILSRRRVYHQNNLFILNLCLNIIGNSVCFATFHAVLYFTPAVFGNSNICSLIFYVYNVACIQIPFAFVIFSLHRLCSIIYHTKSFFKSRQWISIGVLSLPMIVRRGQVSVVVRLSKGYTTKEFFSNLVLYLRTMDESIHVYHGRHRTTYSEYSFESSYILFCSILCPSSSASDC